MKETFFTREQLRLFPMLPLDVTFLDANGRWTNDGKPLLVGFLLGMKSYPVT